MLGLKGRGARVRVALEARPPHPPSRRRGEGLIELPELRADLLVVYTVPAAQLAVGIVDLVEPRLVDPAQDDVGHVIGPLGELAQSDDGSRTESIVEVCSGEAVLDPGRYTMGLSVERPRPVLEVAKRSLLPRRPPGPRCFESLREQVHRLPILAYGASGRLRPLGVLCVGRSIRGVATKRRAQAPPGRLDQLGGPVQRLERGMPVGLRACEEGPQIRGEGRGVPSVLLAHRHQLLTASDESEQRAPVAGALPEDPVERGCRTRDAAEWGEGPSDGVGCCQQFLRLQRLAAACIMRPAVASERLTQLCDRVRESAPAFARAGFTQQLAQDRLVPLARRDQRAQRFHVCVDRHPVGLPSPESPTDLGTKAALELPPALPAAFHLEGASDRFQRLGKCQPGGRAQLTPDHALIPAVRTADESLPAALVVGAVAHEHLVVHEIDQRLGVALSEGGLVGAESLEQRARVLARGFRFVSSLGIEPVLRHGPEADDGLRHAPCILEVAQCPRTFLVERGGDGCRARPEPAERVGDRLGLVGEGAGVLAQGAGPTRPGRDCYDLLLRGCEDEPLAHRPIVESRRRAATGRGEPLLELPTHLLLLLLLAYDLAQASDDAALQPRPGHGMPSRQRRQ